MALSTLEQDAVKKNLLIQKKEIEIKKLIQKKDADIAPLQQQINDIISLADSAVNTKYAEIALLEDEIEGMV